MKRQDGVLSRHQALAAGLTDDDIRRLIRRRVWARLFEGVYVDHTGPPTWRQRAWAGTLLHAPAALTGLSALTAWGARAPATDEPIWLAVGGGRRVVDPAGVRTTRLRPWERLVQPHLSPPRLRLEASALAAASATATDEAAVALLGDLVQQRHTTPARLQATLGELVRLPRRRLLGEVLDDVASGAMSALERRYLRDVERAHALPRARRQHRMSPGGVLQVRDVDYPTYALAVELDGRLGHELWRDRWADFDRDLRSLREGTLTVRAGWGQVLKPCRLAEAVGALLIARGWVGRPTGCGEGCELA